MKEAQRLYFLKDLYLLKNSSIIYLFGSYH